MVSREEAKRLLAINGQVRGAVFETDAEYIKNRYGSDALNKVEAAIRELGSEMHYERLSSMEWMPLGLRVLSLLVMKDLLGWSDEEIKAMGDAAPKHSFIVKLFMKFFISPHMAFSHAPEYWTKHYDTGRLEAAVLDEEKRHAVIRLHDFTLHPVYCKYLEGYFGRLFKFMFPSSMVEIRETGCICKGDTCHEFLVDWKD
jgi:hypothetical protein